MQSYSHNLGRRDRGSVSLGYQRGYAQLDRCLSDYEVRALARSVIRSSGGQCDSFDLFDEMSILGVTPAQFQDAIKYDFEIEVSKGVARLIEK
jgi:hypothetical protein